MKVVQLRVYRGSEVFYTAEGTAKNENHLVKLKHGTLEWKNYMKHLSILNFAKVDVEKIIDLGGSKSESPDVGDSDIIAEVAKAYKGGVEVKLTPDQIKIAELEAKIEALAGLSVVKKQPKTEKEPETPNVESSELDKLKDAYMDKFGKKAYHGWDEEKLKEKLAE